jgi:hypothetical protein
VSKLTNVELAIGLTKISAYVRLAQQIVHLVLLLMLTNALLAFLQLCFQEILVSNRVQKDNIRLAIYFAVIVTANVFHALQLLFVSHVSRVEYCKVIVANQFAIVVIMSIHKQILVLHA